MTTELTRSEKNKKIAEALEPLAKAKLKRSNGVVTTEAGIWTAGAGWNSLPEARVKYFHPAFDFYTDEAANAMVLEAMPAVELYRHPPDSDAGIWRCRPDCGLDDNTVHPDRKTAICEAFLKWIGWTHV